MNKFITITKDDTHLTFKTSVLRNGEMPVELKKISV